MRRIDELPWRVDRHDHKIMDLTHMIRNQDQEIYILAKILKSTMIISSVALALALSSLVAHLWSIYG